MTDADDKKFNREDWVRKIEGLLAAADSYERTGNPEAAATFRTKAEKLMNSYRVQEEELREASGVSLEPISMEFRVCDWHSPHRKQYREMFSEAVYHAGCRAVTNYRTEGSSMVGTVVGFEIDAKYAQLLFLNASVVYAAHLEPAYDPNETEAENIYRLRRSGKTRREIAVLLWGNEVDHSVPAHGKVQKIYEAECAKRGEKPISGRGFNREVYAEIYSKQFVDTFSTRLYRARHDAGIAGDGGMVLANRKGRVDEAFYTLYPEFRPNPNIEVEPYEDKRTDAEKKRDEERLKRKLAAETAKWASPAGRAGALGGDKAAQSVPLRGTTSQGRIDG